MAVLPVWVVGAARALVRSAAYTGGVSTAGFRTVAITPEVQALLAAAVDHHQQGRLQAAEVAYKTLLAAGHAVALVHHNLGLILCGQAQLDEAESHFRTALAIRPEYAIGWNSLGALLKQRQDYDGAVACFREASALQPSYVAALINLGNVLTDVDCPVEAGEVLERALVMAPQNVDALWGLGRLSAEAGETADAIDALTRALAVRPDFFAIRCELLAQQININDWAGVAENEAFVLTEVRARRAIMPPSLCLRIATTPADQLFCAKRHADRTVAASPSLPAPQSRRGLRLRLAYLSCDFREHATAYLASEMLERHDRAKFEVIAYSYGHDDKSPMRARLERAVDRFEDLGQMSDRAAAERLRADGVDILVDLKGYTGFSRPGILAIRPAPLQVNFLGYPGTMGAGFMDYIIADNVLIPPHDAKHFTEQVVYLPDSYQPNDTGRAIAQETPTRADCGLPDAGFVFCCFNDSFKITAPWFEIWMRLLHDVPDSVLWLLEGHPLSVENLRRAALAQGITPDRLIFARRLPLPQHLARHSHADLCLDTLPYNAHTTLSDSLWVGVPAITCVGATFAGRVGASLLGAAGLRELVTTTACDYERLARALATDRHRLASIRAKLTENRQALPLFDAARYTAHIEAAYVEMWEIYSCGGVPRAIHVNPGIARKTQDLTFTHDP